MTDTLVALGWLAALALGFVAAWLIQKYRLASRTDVSDEEKAEKEQQRLAEAEATARLKERVESLDKEVSTTRESAESLRKKTLVCDPSWRHQRNARSPRSRDLRNRNRKSSVFRRR